MRNTHYPITKADTAFPALGTRDTSKLNRSNENPRTSGITSPTYTVFVAEMKYGVDRTSGTKAWT